MTACLRKVHKNSPSSFSYQATWKRCDQNVPGGIWEASIAGGIDELLGFVPDSPMPAIELLAHARRT
jgi:hypothetical protein